MLEKLTIEQFREMKSQFQEIFLKVDESDEDEMQQLVTQYSSLLNQLSSYDLSDIPFEEWEGMNIESTDGNIVDFSHTKANIDFDIVEYSGYGNFQGCNIRGLDRLNRNNIETSVFDTFTIEGAISSSLSDSFSYEFKEKYFNRNLTIEDLALLSSSQVEELSQKINLYQLGRMIESLGIEKSIQLYNYSKEDYDAIRDIIEGSYYISGAFINTTNLIEQLKNIEVAEMKSFCYTFSRNEILNSYLGIKIESLPASFVRENEDLFLINDSIPADLRERYYSRNLTFEDIKENIHLFRNIPLSHFVENGSDTKLIIEKLGTNSFLNNLLEHPDVIEHIMEKPFIFYRCYDEENGNFIRAVKKYFLYELPSNFKEVRDNELFYNVPQWLSSMNFTFYDEINTESKMSSLLQAERPFILDSEQDSFVDFNLQNIRMFEQETSFFSHHFHNSYYSSGLILFMLLKDYKEKDFMVEGLSYDEFSDSLANLMDSKKKTINYDWMQGTFRDKYSRIFMDLNAPSELREAFYTQSITPSLLKHHPEYISYLRGKNLENCFQKFEISVKENGQESISKNFYAILNEKLDFNDIMFFIRDYSEILESIVNNGYQSMINLEEFNDVNQMLSEINRVFRTLILEKGISYPNSIPRNFKENNPDMFLDEKVPENIRDRFYNRSLSLTMFIVDSSLLEIFGNTNIAFGFPREMAWITALFQEEENSISANSKRLRMIAAYSKINDAVLQKNFREYVNENSENIDFDKLNLVSKVLERLSYSNSSEISNFRASLAKQILASQTPMETLEKIEDVFIRNNIPTVGKIYSCFEILHPNFAGFHFDNNDIVSPVLKRLSNRSREIVIFSDLIKSSFGSNNRSVNAYLKNIELGYNIYKGIQTGKIEYDSLDDNYKKELITFSKHLLTLYNNTLKGKQEKVPFQSTGDVIQDILELSKRLSPNGSLDYNLADRVVKMFCGFAGIETLEEAKSYIQTSITNADARSRSLAQSGITLNRGDFVKGIGDIRYLGNILQNGSVSKEYLGSSADSDSTPLDTDVTMILEEEGTIGDKINNSISASYGPIWFVIKNDSRFITTRTDSESLDVRNNLSKLEVFYTGVLDDSHYGIRTGFASSDIDYIVVEKYDARIGLEIAMNGFYIPVVDRQGKIIFTPEDYDKIRERMNGLSYYDENTYQFSENLVTEETEYFASQIDDNRLEVRRKQSQISSIISKSLEEVGLHLKTTIDGDLTPGYVELIDTGSTGRGTNKPGDGDFDYMMRLDRTILANSAQLANLKSALLRNLGEENTSDLTADGDFRLKNVQIDSETRVDIDITFVERTDKISYSTDMSLQDRLSTIQRLSPDNYRYVVANILLAKKVLKEAGVYKPNRGDVPQGGLGGVGVENWILQNGGSFIDAARSFIEVSEGKSFDEFKTAYQIWDFGENHLAAKKNHYAHDNFITNNMSETGYLKMKEALKVYLQNYEYGDYSSGKSI